MSVKSNNGVINVLKEDFSTSGDLTASSNILESDLIGVDGEAFSNKNSDGVLTFKPVDVSMLTAAEITLGVESDLLGGHFEKYGWFADYARVEISVDGGDFITLDTFRPCFGSTTFIGDQTGQVFGDGGDTINYTAPEGASTVQLRLVTRTTAETEILKFDNVAIFGEPVDPAPTPDLQETVIAHETFESGAQGWSNPRTRDSDDGDGYLGGFGRSWRAVDTQKTFTIPEGSECVKIEFDFLEIDNWRNEKFFVYLNGEKIELGAFRTGRDEGDRSFDAGDGVTVTIESQGDGDSDLGLGRGRNSRDDDQVHKVTIEISAPESGPLTLGFGSNLRQNAFDNQWGVDNLKITSFEAVEQPNRTELLRETFDAADLTASENVVSSDLVGADGQAVVTNSTSGAITFAAVSVADFEDIELAFDIEYDLSHGQEFERSGAFRDSFEVQVSIDGGAFVTLDTFDPARKETVFIGDQTGQVFGDHATRLKYVVPDGAETVQLRLVGVTTARGETLKIDNVTVTALPPNADPVFQNIADGAALSIAEDTTSVIDIDAVDPEGAAVSFAITGGADAAAFVIDEATGALNFAVLPNFEKPIDADADNRYAVEVTATDADGKTSTVAFTVDVTDLLIDDPTNPAIVGTDEADSLSGVDIEDNVYLGFEGNDRLLASLGENRYIGGEGLDTYVIGGSSRDGVGQVVNLSTGVDAAGQLFEGIENVTGGSGDDEITGDANRNALEGGLGDDTLLGLGENDTLTDLFGNNNTLDGGEGNDRLIVGDGAGGQTLIGGEGFDTAEFQTTANLSVDLASGLYSVNGVQAGTIATVENATGGSGDDDLLGDDNNNRLDAGEGDGSLDGRGGNDTLIVGSGSNTVIGGLGDDSLTFAAALAVTANLSTGAYALAGGGSGTITGVESLIGGDQGDSLTGDDGRNDLNGGLGDDMLFGLGDADTLTDLFGNNTLDGGDGNDRLIVGAGNNTLIGGDGFDTVEFQTSANITFDLDAGVYFVNGVLAGTFSSIENVTVSAANDDLVGDDANNRLDAGEGDNTLDGRGGNDTLIVGSGSNTIIGGEGVDSITFETALDATVDLAAGTYALLGGGGGTLSGVENIFTGDGNDTLIGDANRNNLDAGEGNNSVTGNDDRDTLTVGDGDNTVDGGGDNDLIRIGAGSNTVIGGDGVDTVEINTDLDVTVDLGATVYAINGGGSGALTGVEYVTTGAGSDTIIGDANRNIIDAGDGDNTVDAGDNNDTIIIGVGSSALTGGAGTDTAEIDTDLDTVIDLSLGVYAIDGGASGAGTLNTIENVVAGDGANTLTGDAGRNQLTVGDGDNTLDGGDNNDTLRVGAGNNTLIGGAGTDTANFSVTEDVTVDLAAGTYSIDGGGAGTLTTIENIVTGNGDDVVTGDAGRNNINVGNGDNTVFAGADNDTIISNVGTHILNGEAGNDTFRLGLGDNTIDGGDNLDTVQFSNNDSVVASLADGTYAYSGGASGAITNVERLTGGNQDDTLTGDATANIIRGGRGMDELRSGGTSSGRDELRGEDGNDILIADAAGEVRMEGGGDADTFKFELGATRGEIRDFDASEGDRIDLTAFGLDEAALLAATTVGSDTQIVLGSLVIDIDDLDAADFSTSLFDL